MHEAEHSAADGAAAAVRGLETGALAQHQLRRRSYRALHQVSCEFRAGVLTLRGRLPTYYLKQVALATVAAVDGIRRIDDQIEVACGRAGG